MQQNLIDDIYNNLRVLNEYIKKTFEASVAYKYSRAHKRHKCYACHKYGHIAKDCSKVCIYCGYYHGKNFCYRELFNLSNKIIYIFLNKSPKEFTNELLKFQYIGNGVRYKAAGERLKGKCKILDEEKSELYKKNVNGLVIYKRISNQEKLQGLLTIFTILGVENANKYINKCCKINKEEEERKQMAQMFYFPWCLPGQNFNFSNEIKSKYDDSKDFKKVDEKYKFKENPFRNILNTNERAVLRLKIKKKGINKDIKNKMRKVEKLNKHIILQKSQIENNTNKQQRQKDAFFKRRYRYKKQLDVLNKKKNKIYNNIERKQERLDSKRYILDLGYKTQRINKLESQLYKEKDHNSSLRSMHPTSSFIKKSDEKIKRIEDELFNLKHN